MVWSDHFVYIIWCNSFAFEIFYKRPCVFVCLHSFFAALKKSVLDLKVILGFADKALMLVKINLSFPNKLERLLNVVKVLCNLFFNH